MAVQQTPARDGEAAAVRAAELALYEAQVESDVDAIAPMLDAGLVYIHSTGVAESKDAYLAGVRDRLYEYGRIESRETSIDVTGSSAFTSGLVDMTVSAHGARKQLIHLLFCLRWKHDGDRWRLVYRQATRLAADDPRTATAPAGRSPQR